MIRRRSAPPDGKKRYSVGGVITISVHTEVEAKSPEEARKIAEQRGIMGLCHQCAGGAHADEEWVTSGELDGEPGPYEANGELEVLEL